MAIEWPIYRRGDTGLGLLDTYESIATQNLIVLLMTNPGERIMDIDFGVGIRHILFENIDSAIEEVIRSEIDRQVATYLPYIEISDVLFASTRTDPSVDLDENYLGIQIKFSIPDISAVGMSLSLSVGEGGNILIGDANTVWGGGVRTGTGHTGWLDSGGTIPGYDDSVD